MEYIKKVKETLINDFNETELEALKKFEQYYIGKNKKVGFVQFYIDYCHNNSLYFSLSEEKIAKILNHNTYKGKN